MFVPIAFDLLFGCLVDVQRDAVLLGSPQHLRKLSLHRLMVFDWMMILVSIRKDRPCAMLSDQRAVLGSSIGYDWGAGTQTAPEDSLC